MVFSSDTNLLFQREHHFHFVGSFDVRHYSVAPGQSKGDLVIKQIFRDPQPPLRLKNPMDNIGNQVFITRTPTSIAEFEASGGWNAQRYELQTMPPLKDIVVKFINLQPYLWATVRSNGPIALLGL